MEDIKNAIKNTLLEYIGSRLMSLQSELSTLDEAKSNETKSSAGDKYETTRAMLQQEIDKKMTQINKWKLNLLKVQQLKTDLSMIVEEGSLVYTDKGTYYFSTAVGKFAFQDEVIFAISTDAPIYKILRNMKKGDNANYNGRSITILSVA